jgi:Zn-dependent protease
VVLNVKLALPNLLPIPVFDGGPLGKAGDAAPEASRGAPGSGCLVRLFFKQLMLVPLVAAYKGQVERVGG